MKAIANHDTAFMIAGEDRVFYPAKFTICDSFIVVSSDMVAKSVAVRYGWDVKFDGCLVNDAALPASPFRTDDWDWSSSTVAK